jgi:hypothetical protein
VMSAAVSGMLTALRGKARPVPALDPGCKGGGPGGCGALAGQALWIGGRALPVSVSLTTLNDLIKTTVPAPSRHVTFVLPRSSARY